MLRLLATGLVASWVLAFTGPAIARPNVTLHLSLALVQHTSSGDKLRSLEHVVLKSGDIVRHTIDATNSGNEAALDLTPVEIIHPGEMLVAGSVHGPASHVEYTLDGKSWSAHPMIKARQPDGKVTTKPADPSQYTALRWRMTSPLPAHKAVSFSYEVRVK